MAAVHNQIMYAPTVSGLPVIATDVQQPKVAQRLCDALMQMRSVVKLFAC